VAAGDGGGFVVAITGGSAVAADGFSAPVMTGGLIASKTLGGFATATTAGGAPGALFATVTSGWSVTTTEEAATTIAHAKTLQRFSVMGKFTPVFRQKLSLRGV
jgi:hypothetical protein